MLLRDIMRHHRDVCFFHHFLMIGFSSIVGLIADPAPIALFVCRGTLSHSHPLILFVSRSHHYQNHHTSPTQTPRRTTTTLKLPHCTTTYMNSMEPRLWLRTEQEPAHRVPVHGGVGRKCAAFCEYLCIRSSPFSPEVVVLLVYNAQVDIPLSL